MLGFESVDQLKIVLGSTSSQLSRQKLINYFQNPTLSVSNQQGRVAQNLTEAEKQIYRDAAYGTELPDGTILTEENLELTFFQDGDANASYSFVNGKHVVNLHFEDFLITTANVRAVMVHEVYGHGIMGFTGGKGRMNGLSGERLNHHRAYFAEIRSRYFENTTQGFKIHALKNAGGLYYSENGNSWSGFPNDINTLYQKYIVNK